MPSAFARIAETYDRLVAERGDAPEACDYGSASSQRAKFEVLAAIDDLSGRTVLDVGCGLAHYADFLEAHHDGVRYAGIDLSPAMIDLARRRRPDLDLAVGNVLDLGYNHRADIVNANGIFYLLGEEAPSLFPRLIERMWELAERALAFNSLSTWAPRCEEGEFQADPLETVAMCRRLSPWVVLRHDYMPHDFTVYVYREPRA